MSAPEYNREAPPNIVTCIQTLLDPGEKINVLLKTEWKPNSTIPILWMAITNNRCLLFSTLRGGRVFKSIDLKEINAVRSNVSGAIEILLNDRVLTNLSVPISPPFRYLIPVALDTIKDRLPN
jgi:hypothetical protein